jgi:hypothetical protein
MINQEFIHKAGYSVEKIDGLDFSGMRRMVYINSARTSIETRVWVWPDKAKGITSQLKAYDHIEDRLTTSKLAQDLVCTSAMQLLSRAGNALLNHLSLTPAGGTPLVGKDNLRNGQGRRGVLRNPGAR